MKGLKSKNRIKMIKGMTEMSIIITGLYLSLSAAMPISPASTRKGEMDAQRIKRTLVKNASGYKYASGCHPISEAI